MVHQRNWALAYWISYHDSRREIAERVSAECTGAKFEKENKMAAACSAAVVSLMEELADDSVLQEASSSEDDEILFFLRQFSDEFHRMIGRNRAKLRPLNTTQMLYVDTRETSRKCISFMKYLYNSN